MLLYTFGLRFDLDAQLEVDSFYQTTKLRVIISPSTFSLSGPKLGEWGPGHRAMMGHWAPSNETPWVPTNEGALGNEKGPRVPTMNYDNHKLKIL